MNSRPRDLKSWNFILSDFSFRFFRKFLNVVQWFDSNGFYKWIKTYSIHNSDIVIYAAYCVSVSPNGWWIWTYRFNLKWKCFHLFHFRIFSFRFQFHRRTFILLLKKFRFLSGESFFWDEHEHGRKRSISAPDIVYVIKRLHNFLSSTQGVIHESAHHSLECV